MAQNLEVTWPWRHPFLGNLVVHISISQHTKSEVPSFIHSKVVIGAWNFKMGHVTLTMPLSLVLCNCRLGLAMINLITKFEVSIGYKDRKRDTKCRKWGLEFRTCIVVYINVFYTNIPERCTYNISQTVVTTVGWKVIWYQLKFGDTLKVTCHASSVVSAICQILSSICSRYCNAQSTVLEKKRSDCVTVLHSIQHTHVLADFRQTFFPARHLAWYWRTKTNTTKADMYQRTEKYYNIK